MTKELQTSAHDNREARVVRVTGLVQGVGFRPTVYRIALALGLTGFVFNDEAGVGIHLEGPREALERFPKALLDEKPPLARIDTIEMHPAECQGLEDFSITASRAGGHVTTAITADAATCDACFADMFDPKGRRWRYAFTNCTHCGPRFTITHSLPYDRPQTSMARFPMCPDCLREYEDPLDRRFHAQPNACPVCGPKLVFTDAAGRAIAGDPVENALRSILAGEIVAMKGIGGFHLVCDACSAQAVARLRARKHRDEKPLAIMAANVASAQTVVQLNDEEKRLLLSPAHPIVLARKRSNLPENALRGIADGLVEIGVMLPYAPLHALLFHEYLGHPAGTDWLEHQAIDLLLVMTSANPGGEPLVTANDEALARLGHIADRFLMHNRDILVRCDDSVVRVAKVHEPAPCLRPVWVRRARGLAPEAVMLGDNPNAREADEAGVDVLALGPYLKNTAAATRGHEAFLTQHIGDLENAATAEALEEAVEHLSAILELEPQAYAADCHPDFFSTRLAERLARDTGKPLLKVPHHAAHVGVVMAELGRTSTTFGLALDGVGLGPEGGIWGGELLAVSATGFERLGALREIALPGGDRAAREPWRMGAAVLVDIGRADLIEPFFGTMPHAGAIAALVRSPLTRRTSAAGRYFDAAAAILGITLVQHDEATAAMHFEAAAADYERRSGPVVLESESAAGGAALSQRAPLDLPRLDLRKLFVELVQARLAGVEPGLAAATFLHGFALSLADWTIARLAEVRASSYVTTGTAPSRPIVALTGGCFLNRVLLSDVSERLAAAGYAPRVPQSVPPGDGGLALGEAWLAKCFFEAHRRTASAHAPLPTDPEYGFGPISKTDAFA